MEPRNLFALPISTCDPSPGGAPVPFRPCGQCATQKPSDLDPALVAGFFPSVFILFSARHRRQDGLVASGSEGGQAPSSALAHTPPLGVPPIWQSGDVPLSLLVPTSAVPRRHACQPETQPPPNPGTRQDMARDTGNMTQPPAQYKRTSNQSNHSSTFIPSPSRCCRCSDIVRNKCRLPSQLKNLYPKKWPSPKKAPSPRMNAIGLHPPPHSSCLSEQTDDEQTLTALMSPIQKDGWDQPTPLPPACPSRIPRPERADLTASLALNPCHHLCPIGSLPFPRLSGHHQPLVLGLVHVPRGGRPCTV